MTTRVYHAVIENPESAARRLSPDEWAGLTAAFRAIMTGVEISKFCADADTAWARIQIDLEHSPPIQTALAALRQRYGLPRIIWSEIEATEYL